MKCYSCKRDAESLNTLSYEEQLDMIKKERPLVWELVRPVGVRHVYNEGEHRYCALCVSKELDLILRLKWDAAQEIIKTCDKRIEAAVQDKDDALERQGLIEKAHPAVLEKK